MDGIHCNDCGAELDEAPTLLPDQRQPAPPAARFPAA
jgi:hypothetical protein